MLIIRCLCLWIRHTYRSLKTLNGDKQETFGNSSIAFNIVWYISLMYWFSGDIKNFKHVFNYFKIPFCYNVCPLQFSIHKIVLSRFPYTENFFTKLYMDSFYYLNIFLRTQIIFSYHVKQLAPFPTNICPDPLWKFRTQLRTRHAEKGWRTYADSESTDSSLHAHSLSRKFTFHIQNYYEGIYHWAEKRHYSVCTGSQAGQDFFF